MKSKILVAAVLLIGLPFCVEASAVAELQTGYRTSGAGPFNAKSGEVMWNKSFVDAKSGKERNCTTCHTKNLKQSGKHERTGKVIEPMAVSINPKRLSDVKKVKKWFVRNCKWTLGRECTAQEKGDFLAYLGSL
jgi:hypothetical protein